MNICTNPFDTLYVQSFAYATCCPSWVSNDCRVYCERSDNPWLIWNAPPFQLLRNTVLSNEYSKCKYCVKWLDGLPQGKWPDWCQQEMFVGPKIINLANDMTCNLHCWSCRSKAIVETNVEQKERIQNKLLNAFLPTARLLSLCHSGDPFSSAMHRRLLQRLNRDVALEQCEVELFTNGLLLPRYWQSLKHIHDNITRISMSIDAATKTTYEKTRLGGRWHQVIAALELLSTLQLKRFAINMVVQKDNFRDIPRFIELGLKYNVTCVQLTMLRPWPHLSATQYTQHNLSDPNHKDYEEFLTVLQHPLLQHEIVHSSKIMDTGRQLIRGYVSEIQAVR